MFKLPYLGLIYILSLPTSAQSPPSDRPAASRQSPRHWPPVLPVARHQGDLQTRKPGHGMYVSTKNHLACPVKFLGKPLSTSQHANGHRRSWAAQGLLALLLIHRRQTFLDMMGLAIHPLLLLLRIFIDCLPVSAHLLRLRCLAEDVLLELDIADAAVVSPRQCDRYRYRSTTHPGASNAGLWVGILTHDVCSCRVDPGRVASTMS